MPPRTSSRTAPASSKAPTHVKPPAASPGKLSLQAPPWSVAVLALLAAILLLSTFTTESADTDTWWHLKTGQYILQQHKLPVPDPFGWTTYMGKPSYPGEEITRYFNLTHEWLSQALLYASYAAGGFTGLILMRGLWLTAFCVVAALIAWRRSRSPYRALAVAFATAMIVQNFIADRPQYFTYVFLAVTILILETRRYLWVLPPLLIIWANCHAGFIMGWVVMGAYCAESLYFRLRGNPAPDERRLWIFCIAAILVSGLNPNGFNVIRVLGYYRQSPMQSNIWEWQRPKYWEMSAFTILLYSSAALLLVNFRKSRPVDWLLLGVFGVSSLLAMRNIFLIGLWGPIVIAAYAPKWEERKSAPAAWAVLPVIAAVAFYHLYSLYSILVVIVLIAGALLLVLDRYQAVAVGLLGILLLVGIRNQVAAGAGFQFHGAMWKYPSDAADFILQHHIKGRILNTYAQGGYLIWRLWPEQQVFIDGRALNEKVFQDANRINMNAEAQGGKSGEELLKEYGIDVIMMDGFEPVGGTAYFLPAALADPSQKEWKLVYQDLHDVIYMRNPPPDLPQLKSLDALGAMEQQCQMWVDHGMPLCSRGLTDVFARIGDRARYQKWAAIYRENRSAENAFTVR